MPFFLGPVCINTGRKNKLGHVREFQVEICLTCNGHVLSNIQAFNPKPVFLIPKVTKVCLGDVTRFFKASRLKFSGWIGAINNTSISTLLLDGSPSLFYFLNQLKIHLLVVGSLNQIPVARIQTYITARCITGFAKFCKTK